MTRIHQLSPVVDRETGSGHPRSGLVGAWPERLGSALGLLPILLAAEGRHVKVVVRAAHLLGATPVGRIGVEDAIFDAKEHTRSV